ncbi:hypothetical protein N4R57_08615 [Rhodobacteraceae bacterium D3-12]|nr:hypothetical protein N4R57_08615 [Rhodobacteraceae bacterium D3-12]
MIQIKFLPAALAISAFLAAPALADSPLTRHFGASNSCYARSYSADHLAKHPKQQVTAIRIDHFPRVSGPFGKDGQPLIYPKAPEIVVNLSVTLRGNSEAYGATGFCWPDGKGMSCGLECDGGRFNLVDKSGTKLLITGGSDIYFHDCDAGDTVLSREPDDKSFLLTRLPDAQCQPPANRNPSRISVCFPSRKTPRPHRQRPFGRQSA